MLAGASLALTPMATFIFRFNNPGALLTLLLVAAAYAAVKRARPHERLRRVVLADAESGASYRRPECRSAVGRARWRLRPGSRLRCSIPTTASGIFGGAGARSRRRELAHETDRLDGLRGDLLPSPVSLAS